MTINAKREPNAYGTSDGLPGTLGELLEVALKDLAKAEATPGYRVVMHQWHDWGPNSGLCVVCLAGGVMAFSLETEPERDLTPSDFSQITRDKLKAIDALRGLYLYDAYELVYRDPPIGAALEQLAKVAKEFEKLEGDQASYERDRAGYREGFQRLSQRLKEEGL